MQNSAKNFRFSDNISSFLLSTLYKNYKYILFKTRIQDQRIPKSSLLWS